MSKRKKEAFRERDEIEEYFSEVKNRSFPTGIIFFLLLLALVGGVCYYYFVLDDPKNIFLSAVNSTLEQFSFQKEDKVNYEFSLDTNVDTTNKEYIDIVDIIEKIALTGKGSINFNKKINYSELTTYYKSDKLLSINTYYENDDYLYLKSNDLFDKTIKIKTETEQTDNKDTTTNNVKLSDVETLINTLKEILKNILNGATYKKEYVDLSGNKVKKVTLIIDKDLSEKFYNQLLDDNNFMESYSKVMNIDISEAKEKIKKLINDLDDEKEEVSLYLSIIKNEFIMYEDIHKKERVTISKDNNTYKYKLYEDSIVEYQGYFELEKNDNEYQISFEYDGIKEEINVTVNIDLLLEYNEDIEIMDTKDAVDSNKLSENDLNKIMNNLSKNKAYVTLSEDLSLALSRFLSTNQNNTYTTA